MRRLALLLVATACGTTVDDHVTRVCPMPPGVTLECVDAPCPDESHVVCVVEHFSYLFPALDPRAPLLVMWDGGNMPACDVGRDAGVHATACTEDPWTVRASSDSLLVHELLHVLRMRTSMALRRYGEPPVIDSDPRHADGRWKEDETLAKLAPNGC